jgi:G:T-mismatch repair DNA endonuclease (very short patch repair protein)
MQAWMEGYIKMDNKPLMLNNTYAVLQGAGFNSQMTQYMQKPVVVIHVQTCWVFPFSCAFFFCEKLHEKIKSLNLNVGFQIALGV